MSDYTLQATWSTKDALSTGTALKAISATELGNEFSAIATAIQSKYDTTNIASQGEAELETSNTVLMTPARVADWADYNAGAVGDLQGLTTAGFGAADAIFGWDDSASAAIGFTLGTGLATSGTALGLSFLGLESLTDPGADRIAFWDDTAGSFTWLQPNNGITISGVNIQLDTAVAGDGLTIAAGVIDVVGGNGITANANDIALTDQAATTSVPVSLSSGTLGFDITALTDFGTTAGVDLDADTLVINDGGTTKEVISSQLVTPEVPAAVGGATDTLAETDFGKVIQYSGATCTVTLPNGLKAGFWANLIYTGTPGAGLVLSATTTLNTANSLTTCTTQYGAVTVLHLGSNVWVAWGSLDS